MQWMRGIVLATAVMASSACVAGRSRARDHDVTTRSPEHTGTVRVDPTPNHEMFIQLRMDGVPTAPPGHELVLWGVTPTGHRRLGVLGAVTGDHAVLNRLIACDVIALKLTVEALGATQLAGPAGPVVMERAVTCTPS